MLEQCIRVKNLSKSFSGRKVVDNLSFEVNKGEVYAILGHNGAGKSTTIDLIMGLKELDSGEATILGMKASKNRKKVFEKVGVQLQHTEYQNMMTVEEACLEYASLYEKPSDYNELLITFGLSELKKSYVNKLSGGERQKLSVILALIGNPEIVFLDELTTGLDVAARREVWLTLKQLKEKGLTIVLTTHYMEEADTICDKVILINKGQIIISGTPEEIKEKTHTNNLRDAFFVLVGDENE